MLVLFGVSADSLHHRPVDGDAAVSFCSVASWSPQPAPLFFRRLDRGCCLTSPLWAISADDSHAVNKLDDDVGAAATAQPCMTGALVRSERAALRGAGVDRQRCGGACPHGLGSARQESQAPTT